MADIATPSAVGHSDGMFDFDHWAVWLQAKGEGLSRRTCSSTFKDSRNISAIASNPSFTLEVDTADRLGYISFWRNGLCDFEVVNATDGTHVDQGFMLDATDTTVPSLFERFTKAIEPPSR